MLLVLLEQLPKCIYKMLQNSLILEKHVTFANHMALCEEMFLPLLRVPHVLQGVESTTQIW